MLVCIYDPNTNRIERSELELTDPMPYVANRYLTVREFRGSSRGNILWSDRRTMEKFSAFRQFYGKPIYVGYAFKRIWEGGHSAQSQHYAGMSFDTGQNLSSGPRRALYNSARSFGRWSYVEPIGMTPTWVHFDNRLSPPACPAGGFLLVRQGDRGVYVFVLQDALNALGYATGGLDGVFGPATDRAVRSYQRDNGLGVDGVVGCATWRSVAGRAVGIGRTSTVLY